MIKRTVGLALATVLVAATGAAHVADWMPGKVGAFAHYLPDAKTFGDVENFDVPGLVKQLKTMRADYFVITLGQNSGYYCAPNDTLEKLAGYAPHTRCSRRDIPAEIIAALKGTGIRFGLYLPCQPACRDDRMETNLGFPPQVNAGGGDPDRIITDAGSANWAKVIEVWARRYGKDVSLWWFDGAYSWVKFGEQAATRYRAACRAGNPDVAIAFNAGVRFKGAEKWSDVWAGEESRQVLETLPESRWAAPNLQWQVLSYLGPSWGRPTCRFKDEPWRAWLARVTAKGGAVTLDLNIDLKTGRLDPEQAEQFRRVRPAAFPIRGVYFATHFGNWYEKASDAEISEYIGELKYWGCNFVSAWFDMHDFTGMDDPAAAPRLRLIKTIFGSCRKNGMASSLGSLANEAFKESPSALRADWRAGQNGYTHNPVGHYHVEICPSKPGGLEQILKSRREVLAAFAETPPDYFWSCPYDQGGCTCSNCAPWGANGYLRTAKTVAALVRQMFPCAKFSISSWRFDAFGPKLGEWAGLCARQEEVRTWADMIVIDQNQLPLLEANPVLPYCPMVEISMDRMLPWGGFGANPRPKMLEGLIRCHPKMAGMMPYSEGLYEDLNKVIGLALLSGKATTAREAVEQYAARYFGAGTEGLVAEAVDILEDNLGHDAYVLQDGRRFDFYSLEQIDPARTWTLECRVSRLNAVRADRALELLNAAEAKMSASAKKVWRWRVLKLRAELDVALGKGATVEALEPRFNELASIYRVGRDTAQCLVPPTRTYLRPGPEVLRNGDL